MRAAAIEEALVYAEACLLPTPIDDDDAKARSGAAPLAEADDEEDKAEDMYSPYVSSPDPSQVAAASEHETPPPTDEGGGPILVRASAGPPSGSANFLDRLAAAEALDSKRAAG